MKSGIFFLVRRYPCTETKPSRFRVSEANYDGQKAKSYSTHGDINEIPHLALLAFLREFCPDLLDPQGEFDQDRDLISAPSAPGTTVFIVTHKG